MIRISGVTRRYGTRVAVERLDLEANAGEVLAFLGPNGAGKTTTIKMLVGLLLPDAGSIELAGLDVVHNPREAKSVLGYVPDQPELYDKLSAREFLHFVAQMHGMSAAASMEAIGHQESVFDLGSFADELTENYSHGMKQRVAFAAALLHDPAVLILDEPMVGLDPRSMRLVKDLLRSRARRGKTVFMSTHTLAVAEEIADRIGVIDRGRLLFLGTVAELQSRLSRGDSSLEDLFLALTETSGEAELVASPERKATRAS